MTGKGNRSTWVRCRWCGRQPVPTKRGRIASHLTPGGVKCVGIGQPIAQNNSAHNAHNPEPQK